MAFAKLEDSTLQQHTIGVAEDDSGASHVEVFLSRDLQALGIQEHDEYWTSHTVDRLLITSDLKASPWKFIMLTIGLGKHKDLFDGQGFPHYARIRFDDPEATTMRRLSGRIYHDKYWILSDPELSLLIIAANKTRIKAIVSTK